MREVQSYRHFTLAYLGHWWGLSSRNLLRIDLDLWVKFRQTCYSRSRHGIVGEEQADILLCSLCHVSTGNCEWSSDRHVTFAYFALYRQGIVSEAQADILLSLTWLCIDRELWVKLKQMFFSRSFGFLSTGYCEWSSGRHLTLAHLALYRQGIVSKARTVQTICCSSLAFVSTENREWCLDRCFTLAYLPCADRELWVKPKKTIYSRSLGFISTRNSEWSSDRHFTLAKRDLYRQGIVS